ncbi:MAG: lipopolysaccharide transport periplasmic protein LptA [Acidiferrobacterales bacterium]
MQTGKTNILGLFLLLVVSVTITESNAAEGNTGEPIRVYARTIEMDDRTGVAVYKGDVSMVDGALSIEADLVKAKMKGGEIDTFDAFGKPVTVDHRPAANADDAMHATSDRLKYYVIAGKLDMFGNVRLQQRGSELRCPELNYDLKTRKVVATGVKEQRRCSIFLAPQGRPKSAAKSRAKKK